MGSNTDRFCAGICCCTMGIIADSKRPTVTGSSTTYWKVTPVSTPLAIASTPMSSSEARAATSAANDSASSYTGAGAAMGAGAPEENDVGPTAALVGGSTRWRRTYTASYRLVMNETG